MMKHCQDFPGSFLVYILFLVFHLSLQQKQDDYLLKKNLHIACFNCYVVPKKT